MFLVYVEGDTREKNERSGFVVVLYCFHSTLSNRLARCAIPGGLSVP